jgi:hypothetical protein
VADPKPSLVERPFFAEHRGALQTFFRRRIRSQADAADLAQEVYVRMLRISDQEAIRNPVHYLYTVANNLVKENAVLDHRQASHSAARSPGRLPFRSNIRARYEFAFNGFEAFAQIGAVHQSHFLATTDRLSLDPRGNSLAYGLPAFTTYDGALGIGKGAWLVQVYGENLTDTRAELYANYSQWYKGITVSRPRTIGLREAPLTPFGVTRNLRPRTPEYAIARHAHAAVSSSRSVRSTVMRTIVAPTGETQTRPGDPRGESW